MKRKFEEWLLLLWFASFEGAKIRDGWRKHYAEKERERILIQIEKLRPYIDEQGQANWFRHEAYVRAIKGDN